MCTFSLFVVDRIIKYRTKKLVYEIKDSISKLSFKLENLERDCQFYHGSLEYICEEIEDKCDDIIELRQKEESK